MAAPARPPFDDELTRYLLGAVTDAEAERLDELSIVDDEFADRLCAAEHELVDAYVHGALSGQVLRQFESRYLATGARRDKVRFAETLAAGTRWRTPTPASTWRDPKWALAAAAALLIAAGYLVSENVRLRGEMAAVRAASAAVQQRSEQLNAQLNAERQVGAETARELAQLRDSVAELERRSGQAPSPMLATFMLTPATRGAGGTTDVVVPAGAQTVGFQLPLDGDDFPRYEASLIDPSSSETLWRSPRLAASQYGPRRFVLVTVAADLLKPRQYVLELSGIPRSGPAESLNTYPFHAGRR